MEVVLFGSVVGSRLRWEDIWRSCIAARVQLSWKLARSGESSGISTSDQAYTLCRSGCWVEVHVELMAGLDSEDIGRYSFGEAGCVASEKSSESGTLNVRSTATEQRSYFDMRRRRG
ncbi:hypothetical protein HBI04_185250 [Parastagonospora nodorum]|nr:hypothetical protein HBI03_196150 [Parastagonospora nodorum]KAH4264934.1 hypothetical protein HBI04_185250 [Parastagonospora nodorum]